MMRKMVIALAAVAVVTAGSTIGASSRGMGHGGYGGGSSHAAVAHPGHAVHGDRLDFRHRFHRNRFAFIGVGLPHGYDDDCYTRVWTPHGWRWRSVCY
jgi:hypothetical protein